MVFGSNLTGLYSGLQPLAAPAKKTTGPFVAAAPAEGMSDTSVALVAGALSGIVADVITPHAASISNNISAVPVNMHDVLVVSEALEELALRQVVAEAS